MAESTADPRPDLIVGIDFGTTGASVAWALPTQGVDSVDYLEHWIGPKGDLIERSKVPTIVVWVDGEPCVWGFEVLNPDFWLERAVNKDSSDPDAELRKLQKAVLEDPTSVEFERINENIEVRKLYKAGLEDPDGEDYKRHEEGIVFFLEKLRHYIKEALTKAVDWTVAEVMYVFSYPNTWDEHTQITFGSLIQRAGYTLFRSQQSFLSLDEASAAMVHFLADSGQKSSPKNRNTTVKEGDLVLVADIGGGTSDITICQVKYDGGNTSKARIVIDSSGKHAGGTNIDKEAKRLLRPELEKAVKSNKSIARDNDPEEVIKEQVDSALLFLEYRRDYYEHKHAYGTKRATLSKRIFPLQFSFSGWDGKSHQLTLEVDKKDLFENAFRLEAVKVAAQFAELGNRLEDEQAKHVDDPQLELSHGILAGGLGSSDYIEDYLHENSKAFATRDKLNFIPTKKRHLAVCKGLVQEQLLKEQNRAFWSCKAGAAYGVVVDGKTEDMRVLVEEGTVYSVPDKKSFKLRLSFDDRGKLASKVTLVTNREKRPSSSWLKLGKRTGELNHWKGRCQQVIDLSSTLELALEQSEFKGKPGKSMKVEVMLNLMHGALAFKVNGQPFGLIRERWHASETTRDSGSSHRPDWAEGAKFAPSIIAVAIAIAGGLWKLIEGLA
ncbi:hypothetical protein BGZ61DRAFT_484601 [Ilyonectria robusta]|uniref:uncharacterized protein n=1 Tax=Ilyonectria robusta TaxID=1079257 RepID=UPI001E8E0E65|nr:uncharacterized protein BGZ61DRAFT_484601 [Ilyonectria robusta]KAH8664771.1 hypothetical protein BGZ61DRAFT_484601 [Ilyonectria robusta]